MDVKEAARDTVYATIGFTAIGVQQIQYQAGQIRTRVDERRAQRREQVEAFVSATREQVDAQREQVQDLVRNTRELVETRRGQVQDRVVALVGEARTRFEEIGERAPVTVPEDLSERIQERLAQVRTQVTELAEAVRANAQKVVQRAA